MLRVAEPAIASVSNELAGLALRWRRRYKYNSRQRDAAGPIVNELKAICSVLKQMLEVSEANWLKTISNERSSPNGFYRSSAELSDVVNITSMKLGRYFDFLNDRLEVVYAASPKTAAEIRKCVGRLREIHCEYLPKMYPRSSVAISDEVNDPSANQTLVSLETFLNGLSGDK